MKNIILIIISILFIFQFSNANETPIRKQKDLINILSNTNDTTVGRAFYKRKGSLKLPVDKGTIISAFGEHPHPVLHGVVVRNDGIEISTVSGSQVKVVFGGKISNVVKIPGARYSVIVKHGTYYTVYSNIYKVKVKVGDIVKEGQSIGVLQAVSAKETNAVLKFQIWHNKEKEDPEEWIKMN